jgi:hypothetical protein
LVITGGQAIAIAYMRKRRREMNAASIEEARL